MNKQALCIGNNRYPADWDADLNGCIPDARNLSSELKARGWSVIIILDSPRSEVIEAAQQVIASAGQNGAFIISNSSHGTQVPDDNGDEEDAMDEATCCFDGNLILDDEWWKMFRAKPTGSAGLF